MVTVSIIINCLNGARYLSEAIQSVYVQTYSDWEIVFWDNASTDESGTIVKSYDERLRYFRADRTVPLYTARNQALKQVRGKYITFLDCDDVWMPDRLEKLIPLFDKKDSIGLVYSNFQMIDSNGNKINDNKFDHLSKNAFRQNLGKYQIGNGSMITSMKVLNTLDCWFDESFKYIGDKDLYLRIAHDWDLKFSSEITMQCRRHEDNTSYKLIDDLWLDHERMLKKFSGMYENFDVEFAKEISQARLQVGKILAYLFLRFGRRKEAREIIRMHITKDYSAFFLYLASFFSHNVYWFLWDKVYKGIQKKIAKSNILALFPRKTKLVK
jgi:glycosyltransferase involved in cell wall biosynthesis